MIKQKFKNDKGVTLTALAISVAVILILTGIVFYNISDNLKLQKLEKLKSDIENLREKISSYYMQYGAIPAKGIYKDTAGIDSISNAVDTGDFLVIDLSAIDNLTLNYGRDYENIKANANFINSKEISNPREYTDLYIINSASHNIFYVKGIELDGEWYYTDYSSSEKDTEKVEMKFISNYTIDKCKAQNTNKYGWKVGKYDVSYECGTNLDKTSSTWRLFYQDTIYTYLIADEFVGSYKPSSYYGSYTDISKMSIVGQRLNSKISTLFTNDNINSNLAIKATAWLTDTENNEWAKYKNKDAIFAIGTPTVELFATSYNKNTDSNHISKYKPTEISLTLGTYGYTKSDGKGKYLYKEDSHGIYNKDDSTKWWLASPKGNVTSSCFCIDDRNGWSR